MWTLPFARNKTRQDEADSSNGKHSLIELRNVVKNYKTAAGDFTALKGIDLVITSYSIHYTKLYDKYPSEILVEEHENENRYTFTASDSR